MSEESVLTAIQVALGKIEVTTRNTERRVENIEQRLDAYVPRTEIKSNHEALETRVKGLEEDAKKLLWYIIALLGTTLSSTAGLAVTIFLKAH